MSEFIDLVERISVKLKAITGKLDGKYTTFNDKDLYQEAILHLWCQYTGKKLYDKTDSFILQNCYFFLKNYIRKTYKKVDRNSFSINAVYRKEKDYTLEDILSFTDKRDMFSSLNADLLTKEIEKILTQREKEILFLVLSGLSKREIGKRFDISHVMVIKIEKRIKEKCKILKEDI